MRLKHCIILLFALLAMKSNYAQDSTKVKKVKILPVPSFGYEPETKTHIGAVSLFTLNFYQDSLTRTSNAKLEFNYTWRKQSILEAHWDYFFREEKWFSKGVLHFSKYPDFYYGIGAGTPDTNELLFESNRIVIDLSVLKNVGNKVFVGLGFDYIGYTNVGTIEEEVNPFPELKDASTFGIKGVLTKDTRNNLLNSTEGVFYDFEAIYNFSTNDYTRLVADIRQYRTFKEKHVLALRLYNAVNINTPAFYDYAILGGDQYVRGYFYGRFRDKNLSSLQVEYRTHLFWKIGIAAFGGLSTTYPTLDKMTDHLLPNYGGGIRFLVDKEGNTNLRFDYALGADGQNGFYVSFGESF
jgi:hypothetical protein